MMSYLISHIDGIMPKGPYPPCLRMADRALLTGYPRYVRHSASMSSPCVVPVIVPIMSYNAVGNQYMEIYIYGLLDPWCCGLSMCVNDHFQQTRHSFLVVYPFVTYGWDNLTSWYVCAFRITGSGDTIVIRRIRRLLCFRYKGMSHLNLRKNWCWFNMVENLGITWYFCV